MAIDVIKFSSFDHFRILMRGGIITGNNINSNLGGLTLTFAVPSFAVTFSASGLSLKQIKEEIETASAGALTVLFFDKDQLAFVETTPSTGVRITDASLARARLGLPQSGTLQGKVFSKPGGTAPSLIQVMPMDGRVVAVVDVLGLCASCFRR